MPPAANFRSRAAKMDLPDIRGLSLRKLGCINHLELCDRSNWRMDEVHIVRLNVLMW